MPRGRLCNPNQQCRPLSLHDSQCTDIPPGPISEAGQQILYLHHIEGYATCRDNSYDNLIVLCPTCHNTAHRSPGQLTFAVTPNMLRYNSFISRQVQLPLDRILPPARAQSLR
ncbi:HNH endonuclease signature motif containing protein [Nitratireductor sp. GCM10026969]|uniref:HNH endonuclease signature motif containing protein n=1 Tax=Nitratireductor sp. GCM10026969 TaxID=3252645 RepID=UPI003613C885